VESKNKDPIIISGLKLTISIIISAVIGAIIGGSITYNLGRNFTKRDILEEVDRYLEKEKVTKAKDILPIILCEYKDIKNKYNEIHKGFKGGWDDLSIKEQIENIEILSNLSNKEENIKKMLE
jgi:hypothetical protein